jgi:transposase
MPTSYRPYEPDQVMLLPAAPQDGLAAGHLAHFINDTVDALELKAFYARYEGGGSRNQPLHPAMMVKVLVDAYATGVFSSRKIERRLHEDLAFRMLAAGNFPRHRTICDFRALHLKELADLFVQVVKLAREMGLVKLGTVAIDGTKVKASASRHKAMSYEQLDQRRSVLGTVDLAGPQVARQHRLAAEHVQRQVAVVVVVGVELRVFLVAVQRHVRRVDVEHQFRGGLLVRGNELFDKHTVQRPGLRARSPILQPAERGGRGQRLSAPNRGLHQHIVAQRLVVVQVFVAAAQPVQALRQQVAQTVADALRIARIGNRCSGRAAQAQVPIDLAQQQQPAVAAQVPTAKVGFNDTPAEVAEIDLVFRTLWHRQSSVVSGVEYL